jgi:hypothetical protein
MRIARSKPTLPRLAIRRGDGLRLAIATAGLLTTLVVVFFAGSYTLRSYSASSAAKAALADQARKASEVQARLDAQARRVGTIVLAADRGGCEEFHFDNYTGAFISVADVDCDTVLAEAVPATKTQQKTGAGMRGMLDSFRK